MRVLHSLLNIPEYALGSKYARILLNMAEFWICKTYAEL